MTTDQLERIKKAAESEYGTHPNLYGGQRDGFKAGAQTILENPGEWGLIDAEIHSNVVKRNFARTKEANQLQSQLTKYRGALERALQSLQARRPHTPGLGAPINIIKSVLEQEVNND